jgi:hypothetical protein
VLHRAPSGEEMSMANRFRELLDSGRITAFDGAARPRA